MELFSVKASVHYYDTFLEFGKAFELNNTDLILTESVIYEEFVKPLHLPCNVLLKDQYSKDEPNEETVDAILQDMSKIDVKRVIAVGGGSIIDIAKVICVKDAYPVRRVMYHEIAPIHDKTLIVLPSTCGTGSEVTYGGIITMKDTGFKTAILDSTLVAAYAVLIPELINKLPYPVFIHCSVDALAHSMESYVSATRGNEFARAAGARAIKILTEGYAELIAGGKEKQKQLQKSFLMASCLGGMAVNNGGAGPVHALAYPLGEVYHMSHGESIYQFLPEIFNFYKKNKGGKLLEELGRIMRPALQSAEIQSTSPFEGLEDLLSRVYPRRRLSACGMTEDDIEPFAENIFAAKQRLLAAAYCNFSKEDAIKIYKKRL